jgi:hypothetical protein
VEKPWKEPGKEFPQNFHGYFVVLSHQTNRLTMHTSLLLKAFEKAEKEIHSDTPTHMAEHLSEYIYEQSRQQFGERRLRDHYTAAKKGDPIDLKKFVADALSTYLGYENYEAFVKAHPSPIEGNKKKRLYKQLRWPVAGLLIVIFVALGYHQLTKERWMVWQEDHYVEASFDEKLLQEGRLKLYNEDRITDFKKIKVDCNTYYKTPDGNALVWYGKNPGGTLEYFTALGKHPETGKTLRELSRYMFEKYVCPK